MNRSEAQQERVIRGISASAGVRVGKAFIHEVISPLIDDDPSGRVSDQLRCYRLARRLLNRRWSRLRDRQQSEESVEIFTAQLEIIADPELSQQIEKHIKQHKKTAQQAINVSFENYIELMTASGSEKFENREIDLADIRDRFIEAAGGDSASFLEEITGEIAVAEEFSPREIIQLSHQDIKGFVMEKGSHTSHAAIIARSMGIPAVVGANGVMNYVENDEIICLNGQEGTVTVNPTQHTLDQAQVLSVNGEKTAEQKQEICRRSSVTTDGHSFTIQANLEFSEELHHVKKYGAEGIGLLRTESMSLAKEDFGSIEEQTQLYEKFLNQTDDKPVTIRLFDVGGDKFQKNKKLESNPYLGWRGVRMLLDEREVLRNQLKAILSVAGKYPGRVKLLIPTVSARHEVTEVAKEVKYCSDQLKKNGQDIDPGMPLGMMIEIPNAAIHAANFANVVDFFSLGTNDLTQYLLAVDRGNALISNLYDQRHPAVWKLIAHVAHVAQKQQVDLEICGELASYPVAAACLVGLGVYNLSMTPISIPGVKKMLTERTFTSMKKMADNVLRCSELAQVKTLFSNWSNKQ